MRGKGQRAYIQLLLPSQQHLRAARSDAQQPGLELALTWDARVVASNLSSWVTTLGLSSPFWPHAIHYSLKIDLLQNLVKVQPSEAYNSTAQVWPKDP